MQQKIIFRAHKFVVIGLSLFFISSSFAAEAISAKVASRAQALIAAQFTSKDMKVVAHQSSGGICGAEGPSIIAEVQVRKLTKKFNEKLSTVGLAEKWETVKTYGIPAAELKSSAKPEFMDSEACLE